MFTLGYHDWFSTVQSPLDLYKIYGNYTSFNVGKRLDVTKPAQAPPHETTWELALPWTD